MRADAGNNTGTGTVASGVESHAEGYNTIASGLVAHAEGDRAEARGNYSHAGGRLTLASANHTYAGGQYSHATADSAWAYGAYARASAYAAHAAGNESYASGQISRAVGDWALAERYAQYAWGGGTWDGMTRGAAQSSMMMARRITTDATPTVLTVGAQAPKPNDFGGPGVNVLSIPTSRAFQLKISTVARRTDVQGEMAGWTWEGLVGRDATGNARIIGTPVQAAWGDAPATDTWSVVVSVDTATADNYVAVTVTGQAAKTIRWVAKMEWVEVAG